MKLLTKEILAKFDQTGDQRDVDDPLVIAVFFNPSGAGYWFATEYDQETQEFFGYVSIFNDWNDEFGYFSLAELRDTVLPPFGLRIERDMYFKPKPLTEALKEKHVTIPNWLSHED